MIKGPLLLYRRQHNDELSTLRIVAWHPVTFFTIVVLMMNSMINNADAIVVGQELGVVAHDVANRISGFSQMASVSQYNDNSWRSVVTGAGYDETIDLPDLVGGKPYKIETSYDPVSETGTVKVSYDVNSNVNRSVSFRSAIRVAPATISSTGANPRIYYDPSGGGSIQVVGY
jgi:hypothetical protein